MNGRHINVEVTIIIINLRYTRGGQKYNSTLEDIFISPLLLEFKK
jgi:hypothetical protein